MAVLASSSVPVIFQPVNYLGMKLIDGSVLNNFPIEPLLNNCDKIIGIHVNAINKSAKKIQMRNILDRSFHFVLSNSVYSKAHLCDLFVDPSWMSRFGMFEMKKAEEVFDCGYQYAKDFLKEKNIVEKWT